MIINPKTYSNQSDYLRQEKAVKTYPQSNSLSSVTPEDIFEKCKDEQGVLKKYRYIFPNEKFPITHGSKITCHVPTKKTLISVGTERTLQIPYDADRIIQADYSPQVCFYNLFNNEMIRACPSREIYLKLRLALNQKDHRHFKEILREINYCSDSDNSYLDLMNDKYIDFMKLLRKPIPGTQYNLKTLERKAPWKHLKNDYDRCYIHNEREFQRVKALADTKKLVVLNIDFSKRDEVMNLVSGLTAESVGILDVSNAWYSKYGARENLELFKDCLNSEGILYLTDASGDNDGRHFQYFGFKGAKTVDPGNQNAFIHQDYFEPGSVAKRHPNGSLIDLPSQKVDQLRHYV